MGSDIDETNRALELKLIWQVGKPPSEHSPAYVELPMQLTKLVNLARELWRLPLPNWQSALAIDALTSRCGGRFQQSFRAKVQTSTGSKAACGGWRRHVHARLVGEICIRD